MLRITLIQSSLHWENKTANLQMFSEKIASITEESDVIVLPEMFTTGFTMNACPLAESMDGPTVKWMQSISRERNCAITGSVIIEEEGYFYNRLIWALPEGIIHYDKRHLFSYANEQNTYKAGRHQWIIAFRGWKIFPLICYDLRFPVWSRRRKKMDYDLLLYVANWPERRNYAWKQLLIARAIENQSYTAGLNRVGNDGNDIFHSGDSVVVDYKGEPISSIRPTAEMHQTISLDLESQIKFRQQFAFGPDADEFELRNNE